MTLMRTVFFIGIMRVNKQDKRQPANTYLVLCVFMVFCHLNWHRSQLGPLLTLGDACCGLKRLHSWHLLLGSQTIAVA